MRCVELQVGGMVVLGLRMGRWVGLPLQQVWPPGRWVLVWAAVMLCALREAVVGFVALSVVQVFAVREAVRGLLVWVVVVLEAAWGLLLWVLVLAVCVGAWLVPSVGRVLRAAGGLRMGLGRVQLVLWAARVHLVRRHQLAGQLDLGFVRALISRAVSLAALHMVSAFLLAPLPLLPTLPLTLLLVLL